MPLDIKSGRDTDIFVQYEIPDRFQDIAKLLFLDTSNIIFIDNPLADDLCFNVGAICCARDNKIFASKKFGKLDRRQQEEIFAHELSHLVQYRNASKTLTSSQEHELEIEARDAAKMVLLSKPYKCLLSANPRKYLKWDQAGHYYTVALAYANAGLGVADCCDLAQMCWVPDQVAELAATEAAIGHKSDVLNKWYENRSEVKLSPGRSYVELIQTGLHSLTGREIEKERGFRISVVSALQKSGADKILRGIALHALGDCYSHSEINGKYMFKPPLGHFEFRGVSNFMYDDRGQDYDKTWTKGRALTYRDMLRVKCKLAHEFTGKKLKVNPDLILYALTPIFSESPLSSADMSKLRSLSNNSKAFQIAEKLSKRNGVAQDERSVCEHICEVSHLLIDVNIQIKNDIFQKSIPWDRYYKEYYKGYFSKLVQPSDGRVLMTILLKKAADWTYSGPSSASMSIAKKYEAAIYDDQVIREAAAERQTIRTR